MLNLSCTTLETNRNETPPQNFILLKHAACNRVRQHAIFQTSSYWWSCIFCCSHLPSFSTALKGKVQSAVQWYNLDVESEWTWWWLEWFVKLWWFEDHQFPPEKKMVPSLLSSFYHTWIWYTMRSCWMEVIFFWKSARKKFQSISKIAAGDGLQAHNCFLSMTCHWVMNDRRLLWDVTWWKNDSKVARLYNT